MPYAFEGNMDWLNKLRQIPYGMPQPNPVSGLDIPGGLRFEGDYAPWRPGKGNGFGPRIGGSGPMGFPNPLAGFRPYMDGANPMGRARGGMGMARQY